MQRRLLDEATHVENHTSTNQHIYYCFNCVLNLNDSDANRFETRMFMKKVRVVLKPISGTNLLVCPRCHSQHFNRDFYAKKNKGYKRL